MRVAITGSSRAIARLSGASSKRRPCLSSAAHQSRRSDLIFKPRGRWQTFWNAGDEPAVILELLSPGGFERAFREMHALGEALDVESLVAIAARYGCSADLEATTRLIERHGLSF